MKQMTFWLGILFCSAVLAADPEEASFLKNEYTVQIDYSDSKQPVTRSYSSSRDMSALEVLMHVAVVETHPVSDFVFVTSIDQVAGERGKTAWYYKVNGLPAKLLAMDNILSPGDTLQWVYKKDVCSITVDGKCKMAE